MTRALYPSAPMKGLYAIADLTALDSRGLDPVAFAGAVLDGGAALLQLRAKKQEAKRVLGLLRSLRRLCAERGVVLVANDRIDLAFFARCDAVHVGQDDPDPEDVRALADVAGQPIKIGISTHDEEQAERAARRPVDYVAVGPVLGTATKENPDPVLGIARARAIADRVKAVRDVPLVAIGGIDARAASELAGAFDAVAVVAALLPAEGEGLSDVRRRAREIVEALAR